MSEDLLVDINAARFVAAVFFVVAILVALAFYFVMRFIARRGGKWRAQRLASALARSVAGPGALFLFTLGTMVGLLLWPDIVEWHPEILVAGTILLVFLGAKALKNLVSALLGWYAVNVAPETPGILDDTLVPMLSRVASVVIWGLAVLVVLDMLDVSISPLLGGLGITGLAVAVGLQPTLNNFFSGAYVLSEGIVSIGDYIEVHGGPAGYVESFGWRSTKIRTWLHNFVIIPNSVMSSSIVTNYSRPDPKMNVLIYCGVSYDSDLEHVNKVALEVATETINANEEAVSPQEPWFGYERFGDSNIDFWIFIQASDRVGSFIVTNDLIKRLHARFREEGIEINYPVRKLVYDDGMPSITPPRQVGV